MEEGMLIFDAGSLAMRWGCTHEQAMLAMHTWLSGRFVRDWEPRMADGMPVVSETGLRDLEFDDVAGAAIREQRFDDMPASILAYFERLEEGAA